jgi:hypothetical protein
VYHPGESKRKARALATLSVLGLLAGCYESTFRTSEPDALEEPDVPDVAEVTGEPDVPDVPATCDDVGPGAIGIPPTDDASTARGSPDGTSGSSDGIWIRNNDGAGSPDNWEKNFLLAFDLSAIPTGTTIDSAWLNLYYYRWKDNDPRDRVLTLRRLLGGWGEETVTWNTEPEASSEVSATARVPDRVDTWMSWDVTDDVRGFLSGARTNHGWILRDEVSWGTYDIPMIYFRTKEYGEHVPCLVVSW